MSPPSLGTLCAFLAVCAAVADATPEVRSSPGEDCALQCTAELQPGVRYHSVRWYKVSEPPSPRLSGLLTRELPDGTTRRYDGAGRGDALRLDETHGIVLSNATCGDAGLYACHLEAPVGEQNREGRVLLTLTGCSDLHAGNASIDAYIAVTVLMCAFVLFLISYVCLKNTLKEKHKTPRKETSLDAPLRPLEKKDLMMIYTLGTPKPTVKHICV